MNHTGFTPPDPTVLFAQSTENFTRFWNDFSERCASLDGVETPNAESMKQMRGAFLDTLSGAFDHYMRTPEFTAQLRQMLQQGAQFQRQMSEMLGQARHATQGPSRQDIDSIMEGMQRLERRLTDGFERIDERIIRLEDSVGRTARKGPKGKKKSGKAKKAANS